MEIQLIKTLDANNVMNKTLTLFKVIQVRLKADFDIIRPNLILKIDFSEINNFNYVFFPEFNRYYFVDKVVNINNSMFNVYLSCDLIETYKNDILNSNAVFTRDIKEGDYINPDVSFIRYIPENIVSNVELGNTPSILVSSIVIGE